jgi:hypothetical protein
MASNSWERAQTTATIEVARISERFMVVQAGRRKSMARQ